MHALCCDSCVLATAQGRGRRPHCTHVTLAPPCLGTRAGCSCCSYQLHKASDAHGEAHISSARDSEFVTFCRASVANACWLSASSGAAHFFYRGSGGECAPGSSSGVAGAAACGHASLHMLLTCCLCCHRRMLCCSQKLARATCSLSTAPPWCGAGALLLLECPTLAVCCYRYGHMAACCSHVVRSAMRAMQQHERMQQC